MRVPRRFLVGPSSVNHCYWRAHNLERVFDDAARRHFYSLLLKYKSRFGILIYGYCLMGTHPHVITASQQSQEAFSRFWKPVNQAFARWHNRRRGRRGQVVMERLGSPMIHDDRHLLKVLRYVELNPVRAGLATKASDWKWSSHRHHALGVPDALVDAAPSYQALGGHPAQRRKAYQGLFAEEFLSELLLRRDDLVRAPFIGDPGWVGAKLAALARALGGRSPPV
jgi:putative transposase